MAVWRVVMLLIAVTWTEWVYARHEVEILLEAKAALDPTGNILGSWVAGGNPCGGSFEGVTCNAGNRVTSVSLQGRALSGSIPSSLSELAGLTDLYLNGNNLSGTIPPELRLLSSLQVLELCCNKLEGGIPRELGQLSRLRILALQLNNLSRSIPESLGNLSKLTHLDVSVNMLGGSIPTSLANLTDLNFLDVHENQLSGPMPVGLHGLQQRFIYGNNSGLCGDVFVDLSQCAMDIVPVDVFGSPSPQADTISAIPGSPSVNGISSADTNVTTSTRLLHRLKSWGTIGTVAIIAVIAGGGGISYVARVCIRRRKARIVSAHETMDSKLDKDFYMAIAWVADSFGHGQGSFRSTPDVPMLMSDGSSSLLPKGFTSPTARRFWIYLDELEISTNFFSEKCLLGKNMHSAVYKGTLTDGSTVAIKGIYNTRFSSGEGDFQTGIDALSQLRHENIVTFRGFCTSKAGAECFLVYDFVPNGSLQHHLHGKMGDPLDWPSRVSIAKGIAKGLTYLHDGISQRIVIHQNLWVANVLLDTSGNALLSDYGLSDIVAEEVMYAVHKNLAALGYLAPEYGCMQYMTDRSDVYAFGAILLELLTGRRPVFVDDRGDKSINLACWVRSLLDIGMVRDFMDTRWGTITQKKKQQALPA